MILKLMNRAPILAAAVLLAACSAVKETPATPALEAQPDRAVTKSIETCAPCEDGGHYQVHLTFDDGPYKTTTRKILNVLRQKGVEATFFELTSAYSTKQSEKALCNFDDATPQQLQAILNGIFDGGNNLAVHTLEHLDHVERDISLAKAEYNIRRGTELAPKGSLKYLRLPYGRGWYKEAPGSGDQKRADAIMSYIHKLGYKHLGWDIDSFDWSSKYHSHQPKAMLADICTQHGGVILMHDIQAWEARHLGEIIDSIRCSGHEIVGLDAIEDLNRRQPLTSFEDRANYEVVSCPKGLATIKDGTCLVKPGRP